ncbi:hypothetical protein E4U19_000086 [Claviceps sp. Clav32 group G5]|nr:hypothetical protein E4U19_000086 [Claviceps sp. Clav32 group G5]
MITLSIKPTQKRSRPGNYFSSGFSHLDHRIGSPTGQELETQSRRAQRGLRTRDRGLDWNKPPEWDFSCTRSGTWYLSWTPGSQSEMIMQLPAGCGPGERMFVQTGASCLPHVDE